MNKTSQLAFITALLVSAFTSNAAAVSNDELLKRIETLTQRVEVLEERLQIVEEKPEPAFISAPTEPLGPWQQVDVGMKFHEIEELLGKPTSKQKGAVELWFYSDKRKDGPFVKFVFKQTQSWRGPEADK